MSEIQASQTLSLVPPHLREHISTDVLNKSQKIRRFCLLQVTFQRFRSICLVPHRAEEEEEEEGEGEAVHFRDALSVEKICIKKTKYFPVRLKAPAPEDATVVVVAGGEVEEWDAAAFQGRLSILLLIVRKMHIY
jgi:hypothetical protein